MCVVVPPQVVIEGESFTTSQGNQTVHSFYVKNIGVFLMSKNIGAFFMSKP